MNHSKTLSETETVAIGLLKEYNDGRNETINKVSGKWAALFTALVNDGHAMVADQTKARDAAQMALECKQVALDKATAELEILQQALTPIESK
jgi:hypothetical protein